MGVIVAFIGKMYFIEEDPNAVKGLMKSKIMGEANFGKEAERTERSLAGKTGQTR